MATQEEIVLNVKSNIGEVTKDAEHAVSEFELMGVSLSSVKGAMKTVAATSKSMFGSIKAGLISTGFGAFLVLVGSLVSYFQNTKKGSEALKRTLAGLGAIVKVLTNLFSSIGEMMVGAFNDPKQAIADLWEAIKKNLMNRLTGVIDGLKAVGKVLKGVFTMDWDAVAEGAKEYGQAIIQVSTGYDTQQQQEFLDNIMEINENMGKAFKAEVERTAALQKLTDAQRELNIETAESIAWIEKQKLIAEDITKSYEEREAAATKAFKKEKSLEDKRIALAVTAVRLEKERHALLGKDGVMAEDLDNLAELEINLANVRQESAGRQISLQNFLNGLRQQEQAEKDAIREKEIADDDAMWAKKISDNDAWNEKQIADAEKVADAKIKEANRVAKEEEEITKAVETFKKATISAGFGAAAAIAGENTALSKGVAAAQVVYNTQQGIMAAMGATSVADKLLPYPLRLANAIATGAMGAAALSKIMSTDPSGAGAGGGGGVGGASGGTPAPQMMSGAFDISGGLEPEATRAYVVTDEMTNSQNQLANIRRRATI